MPCLYFENRLKAFVQAAQYPLLNNAQAQFTFTTRQFLLSLTDTISRACLFRHNQWFSPNLH